jgi:glyoxalase family protein
MAKSSHSPEDRQLTGVHHVSALSADIRGTYDFYSRVIGLRPLLKTVNQDAPTMYHIFLGDGAGTPGSDITFFDMPRAAPGREGTSSISSTTLRIRGGGSIEYWRDRLREQGVPHRDRGAPDGRGILEAEDNVGTRLLFVEDVEEGGDFPWEGSPVPAEHQVRGLGYPVITVRALEPTAHFLTEALGLARDRAYRYADAPHHDVHVFRMAGGGVQREVHVEVRPDLASARYGSGSVHHVALRVPPEQSIREWAERLSGMGFANSGVVDRYYFQSVYVREPNAVLFELATDGPGFEVDGPLGMDRLKLPPFLEPRRAEIEARLQPLDGA